MCLPTGHRENTSKSNKTRNFTLLPVLQSQGSVVTLSPRKQFSCTTLRAAQAFPPPMDKKRNDLFHQNKRSLRRQPLTFTLAVNKGTGAKEKGDKNNTKEPMVWQKYQTAHLCQWCTRCDFRPGKHEWESGRLALVQSGVSHYFCGCHVLIALGFQYPTCTTDCFLSASCQLSSLSHQVQRHGKMVRHRVSILSQESKQSKKVFKRW